MTTAHPSWTCIQISALIPRATEALHEMGEILGLDGLGRSLTGGDVAALKHAAAMAAELAERTLLLATALPAAAITVERDAVSAGAAEDLANGILEPERALLAASTLGIGDGFSSLAEALRSTEAHKGWNEVTIDELLACFDGADADRIHDVLAAAGLAANVPFEELGADDAASLAASLARHASPR